MRGSSREKATAVAERVLGQLGIATSELHKLASVPADRLVMAIGDNSKMANRVAGRSD